MWRTEQKKGAHEALAPRNIKPCHLAKPVVCTALRSSALWEAVGAHGSSRLSFTGTTFLGFAGHTPQPSCSSMQDRDPREHGHVMLLLLFSKATTASPTSPPCVIKRRWQNFPSGIQNREGCAAERDVQMSQPSSDLFTPQLIEK